MPTVAGGRDVGASGFLPGLPPVALSLRAGRAGGGPVEGGAAVTELQGQSLLDLLTAQGNAAAVAANVTIHYLSGVVVVLLVVVFLLTVTLIKGSDK